MTPAGLFAALQRVWRGAVALISAAVPVILGRPLVLETEDGERGVIRDRRQRWALTKPRWFYTLWVRKLDCGCSRRFGRMVLYSGNCMKHSRAAAYFVAYRDLIEDGDWFDIRRILEHMLVGKPVGNTTWRDGGLYSTTVITTGTGETVCVIQQGPPETPTVDLVVGGRAALDHDGATLDRDDAAKVVRALINWLADTTPEGDDDD